MVNDENFKSKVYMSKKNWTQCTKIYIIKERVKLLLNHCYKIIDMLECKVHSHDHRQ